MLSGIITKIYGRETFTYTLHNGEHSTEFISNEFFQQGESVSVECIHRERQGKLMLIAEKIEKIKDTYPEIEKKISESVQLYNAHTNKLDNIIERMKPDFEKIARKIYAAQQLNRCICVRFHNDADGISSALILKFFLQATYIQHNSPVYTIKNGLNDLERMGQEFKPLLILLDFGNGEDSAEGLALAKAGGIEIIGIDHHPPSEKSRNAFILCANPWNADIEDGSKYPVGFLCAIIVQLFGIITNNLENIACAGDKSNIREISDEDREKALAFDFAAVYSEFGNDIEFYSEMLANKELFNSIAIQAHTKLKESKERIKTSIKTRTAGNVEIYWLNIESIYEQKEFPSRSKLMDLMLELIPIQKPAVAIGLGKRIMIFRLNEKAFNVGIKANEIVKYMKVKFPDFVENGGGHARAAAFRIKQGFENVAFDEVVKIISDW